ncbi:hypothetical protein WJX77_003770 [Trebouxia sp. C0004]
MVLRRRYNEVDFEVDFEISSTAEALNGRLSVTTLNSKSKEELCAWFESYLWQGWKGSARNALTECGKQREDNSDDLQRRELARMKETVFTTASKAQARDFLLRMDEPHLSRIGQQSKLQSPDFGSVGGKAAKDLGYNNDHMDYDKNTCQLFILWAWAHM